MLPTCDSGSGSGSAVTTTTPTSASSQLLAIVTGGQTGVDRAVMQVALSHGVLHLKRSFCPRNYWAEDEQIPAAYHAYFTPTASADPAERTRRNVEASQATLIISTRKTLPPTTLTAVRHAKGIKQPHKHICSLTYNNDALAAARDAAAYLPVPLQCLHVGGPRASEDPQAHDWATQVLTHLIPLLIEAQTMPRRDALVPYLKQSRPCMAHVKQKLLEDGYCIVPSVLSKEECDAEMDRLWEYITTRSPAVRRDDASTWYPAEEGDDDPWPHTGWKSFSDMFQSHGAGWVFSELRVKLADRVFTPLFGTSELHCSKEGFTFQRPTTGNRHPFRKRATHVCGKPCASDGEHFDQGSFETGLQYIQSSTALLDQHDGDGCFLCWPGSHRHHARIAENTYRGRSNWFPLTDDEIATLRDDGLVPLRVPVRAGDVILWLSDLAHAGAMPVGERDSFRAVAYAAMAPAELTPPSVWRAKKEAFERGHTGDHSTRRECWHYAKSSDCDTWMWKPPFLSHRQKELYGLVRYD